MKAIYKKKAVENMYTESQVRQLELQWSQMHINNFFAQYVSALCFVMAKQYGWGKKRLQSLVESIYYTSQYTDILHREFDTIEIMMELEKRYDLDIKNKSVLQGTSEQIAKHFDREKSLELLEMLKSKYDIDLSKTPLETRVVTEEEYIKERLKKEKRRKKLI